MKSILIWCLSSLPDLWGLNKVGKRTQGQCSILLEYGQDSHRAMFPKDAAVIRRMDGYTVPSEDSRTREPAERWHVFWYSLLTCLYHDRSVSRLECHCNDYCPLYGKREFIADLIVFPIQLNSYKEIISLGLILFSVPSTETMLEKFKN